MMKAAVYRTFGGPIHIENVPRPTLPDSDDGVIVQVRATGVCRSDWHGWKGHDDDIRAHGLPFVPGHEFAGVVVQAAACVTSCRVGDAVVAPFILACGHCHYCVTRRRPQVCEAQQQPGFTYWGSFAEYVAIPRANLNVKKIPPGVSFVQAAALGCRFTTAYRAVVQQGGVTSRASDKVRSIAVFGCGGVGLSCIMVAVAQQVKIVIGVDVSEKALIKAKELGATHAILTRPHGDPNHVRQQVCDITGADGADVCIDAAGFTSTCESAIQCTRRAGRMVQVGLTNPDAPPSVPMTKVAGWELEVIGSHGFAAADLPDLLNMVAAGQLDPAQLVNEQVTLQGGIKALEAMDNGSPLGITMITNFDTEVQTTTSKL